MTWLSDDDGEGWQGERKRGAGEARATEESRGLHQTLTELGNSPDKL